MNIPNELLGKWENLRSVSDVADIAEIAGVATETIRRAFRTGVSSDEVFTAMADFYNEKLERINQYITD